MRRAHKQMECFGQNRFAGDEKHIEALKNIDRPAVMFFTGVQEGDEGSGVEEKLVLTHQTPPCAFY